MPKKACWRYLAKHQIHLLERNWDLKYPALPSPKKNGGSFFKNLLLNLEPENCRSLHPKTSSPACQQEMCGGFPRGQLPPRPQPEKKNIQQRHRGKHHLLINLWKNCGKHPRKHFSCRVFYRVQFTSTQQANESLLATLSEAFLTDELEDAYDP